MKIPPLPHAETERDPELAKLREDVAQALRAEKPNVVMLTAALERVDAMLNAAQAELASAVYEIVEQLGGGAKAQATHFQRAWSLLRPELFRR